MDSSVVIAVDAMGGDFAPDVVLQGITQALEADAQLSIIVCGLKDVVVPFCAHHTRLQAECCSEIITMAEHPALAVRKKKDSSLVRACRLVKEGKAQGVYSAGSTGACLTAAIMHMGRIKGIMRPALCVTLPTKKNPVLLCDVGANADCKPAYLEQFAHMAQAYCRATLTLPHPRVALLNIGEEREKGSQFAQDVHALLEEHIEGFQGNIEGRDLLSGDVDVVVCDGFTGNVALKTLEGTASFLMEEMRETFLSSITTKLAAFLVKDQIRAMKARLNPDTYGGAPLLGVEGVCMIGHGSSSKDAICNGILMCAQATRGKLVESIRHSIGAE